MIIRRSNQRLDTVKIYTDGACRGNPGLGGWGALLITQKYEKTLLGGEMETTNNRMELTAAIKALEFFQYRLRVDIFTDSQYLKFGILKWIKNWKNNGWLTSNKKPVKNTDLWIKLDAYAQRHIVDWHWVKGHSGDSGNETADALANQAIITMRNNATNHS